MPNAKTPVDLGFAEFAAQLVAELQEAVLAAQDEQDARRAKFADLASIPVDQFARRFVGNEQVDAELKRLFPVRGDAPAIREGMVYRPAGGGRAESPPIQSKLGIKIPDGDLRVRGRRFLLRSSAVRTIRAAVRARLADARIKSLKQTLAQGMPRVVVDSGRVNVKLLFRLVDLERAGVRPGPRGLAVPLVPLGVGSDTIRRLTHIRLVVRQVNEETTPSPPTETSGIGELDLTFKTI